MEDKSDWIMLGHIEGVICLGVYTTKQTHSTHNIKLYRMPFLP